MLLAYAAVIRFDRRLHRYRLLGRWWRPEWKRFGGVLRVGLPICGTILAEAGMFNGAAFLMGRIGETELAAHTVALQLAAIAFQVPFGVSQAATIRVGLAFGAGDRHAVGVAGRVAIALGMGFMLLSAGTMLLAPRAIMRLYIDPDAPANAALVALAVQYMVVCAASSCSMARRRWARLLRGIQDTRVPMGIALFGYWVPGLGTAIGLGLFTPLRGGRVAGLMIGLIVVAALMLWRWHRRERLGLLTPG
jgi:MATE family multidrug resistance protein